MFGGNGLPFTRHSDVLNAKPADEHDLTRLVEELKRRGNAAFTSKSFEEAEVLYGKAIEVNASNPLKNQHIFYANRSASRCNMGKCELALEDAESCIALDNTYAKGFFRQAQALNKLKRFKDAIDALEKAKALEPSNKSVLQLYDQVKALAQKQAEAPAPAPASTSEKKVTRVEVVKTTSSTEKKSAAATTKTSNEDDVEMEEADLRDVRGYKKLADGRVTTYFNNELSDEAKRLIGDIAPKKVEDPNKVQIKNVEGGSAWNVGNTFEEKDMSSWAKSKLETLLADLSAPVQKNGLSGTIQIKHVGDINGDASIAVVRGAKRYIFDYTFTLQCTLTLDGSDAPVDGQLKFLDMSADCGGDYDVEAVVPTRYSSASGKTMHEVLASSSSAFRTAINKQLAQFVTDFHTF